MRMKKDMGVQNIFQTLAAGSCYALCLSKWLNPTGLQSDHMRDVILGWRKDYIKDNGFVAKPEEYLSLIDPYHRKFKVTIVEGKPPKDKDYPTFFSIDGLNGHFVLCKDTTITWNPLTYSKNVDKGKIVSWRKIEIL